MKKLIVYTSLLSLVACSSATHNSRTVASVAPSLEGSFLGVSNYGFGHDGPDKAATRIYFHPIKEKAGNYNVILLEYVDLLKMAPGYVASNKLPKAERAEMFTNKQSAFLKGNFSVSEPRDGMFLFNTVKATKSTKAIVEGKIGLFIDIFDATKALGQDVVELCLINTDDPKDFLMYYEDPANGEGANANLR